MATKKVKHYDGDIYYDHYGYMRDDPTVRRIDIKADQSDGVYLLNDQWDSTTKSYVKVRSNYTLAELNAGPPIQPQHGFVASVDSHVSIPNIPFDDELLYKGFARGQYSTDIELTSNNTGRVFRVFMKDFDAFAHNMVMGVVRGKFVWRKRGYKFGLMFLQ